MNTEYYIDNMVQEFLEELNSEGKIPCYNSLFKANTKSPELDTEKAKSFHSFMIKEIFLFRELDLALNPVL